MHIIQLLKKLELLNTNVDDVVRRLLAPITGSMYFYLMDYQFVSYSEPICITTSWLLNRISEWLG
jgi:hypothetical protein